MCDLCATFDFRRVKVGRWVKNEPLTIFFVGGGRNALKDDERFRFCPVCGRRLTETDFQTRER